jgi:hypothetical protein
MNKTKMTLSVLLVLLCVSLLAVAVMADPGTGNGTVFAYSDSAYTNPLPQDSSAGGSWVVINGETVYLQIAGITEFSLGQSIEVSLGTPYGAVILGTFTVKTLTSGAGSGLVGVGDTANPINWLVGDLDNDGDTDVEIPYCTTITVHYRSAAGGETWVASGMLIGGANHLHVIPEYILGTAGALMSFAAAVGVFTLAKRRKLRI